MPLDLNPRLLRCFLAVAEELHFTRAAARIPVAQQALSRDVRALERQLGVRLFRRTSRSVELTEDGRRLLPLARRVLDAHDEVAAAFRAVERPLAVDAAAPEATGQVVLDAARRAAPQVEFVARYHSGLARAAEEIRAGRLDVSFGRFAGLEPSLQAELAHTTVRYERVAVVLPEDDPRVALEEVPLDRLRGEELYAGAGNPDTSEWTAYAEELVAGSGVRLVPPFPRIEGHPEFLRLVCKRRWLVLASEVFAELPGLVLRPLVAPRALSPVSLVHRRDLRHPGLEALRTAAGRLAREEGWLRVSAEGWLPDADREVVGWPASEVPTRAQSK